MVVRSFGMWLLPIVVVAMGVATINLNVDASYVDHPAFPFSIQITQPTPLAGAINYAPSNFGPSLLGDQLSYRLMLPHSSDDPKGCSVLRSNVSDDGTSLVGQAVLVQRGGCAFSSKVSSVQASGAAFCIIYGCDPAFCDAGLVTLDSPDDVAIPVVFIDFYDGTVLAGAMRANTSLAVQMTINGTGPIDPTELAAVNTIVNALTFGDAGEEANSQGSTRLWSTQIANPTLDPCTNRLHGFWCENGHVTNLYWSFFGFNAAPLPAAIGSFTKLKVLSVSQNAFTGGVPCSFGSLTKLAQLDISTNQLTSLPNCAIAGAVSTLVILLASGNSIAAVPTTLSSLVALRKFDLSANALTGGIPDLSNNLVLTYFDVGDNSLTGTMPRFFGRTTITIIRVRNNRLSGVIAADHFDGCTSLTNLDLSHNNFVSALPDLNGLDVLNYLDLSFNGFYGVLPDPWANLATLVTLIVSNNAIVSPFTFTIGSLSSLQTLDMSFNQLTAFDGDDLDTGDMGAIIFLGVGSAIVSVNFAHNNFSGPITSGWCCGLNPNIRQFDVSYNQITALDNSMFTWPLQYFDASHNAIDGTLPSVGSPDYKWQTILLNSNPKLVSTDDTLPAWVKPSTASFVKEEGTLFACPVLGTTSRVSSVVSLDASYYGYKLCKCDAGTFGFPPECSLIPATASTPRPNVTGFDWSVRNPAYDAISDSSFGSSRLISGMDTSWFINSTELLLSTGSYSASRPVLGVKVTLEFTGAFSLASSNSLGVYDGGTDLKGERLGFFVGDGTSRAFNATVTVLSSIATINFKSRDASGVHFVASFLFAYNCPDDYYLPATLPKKCVPVPHEASRAFPRILGVLTLLWQILSTVAASLLLYAKRRQRSIDIQGVWILAATVMGFWLLIEPPIVGIVNDTFPCGVTYWFDLLWQPVLLTAILMVQFRLYVYSTIQTVRKKQLQRKELNKANTLLLSRLGRWIRPQYQLLFAALLMVPPLLTNIIAYAISPEPFVSPNTNCREDTRIDVIQLIYFLVYLALFATGLTFIRDARDAFGLGRRVGWFGIYYIILSLVYQVLKFAASSSHMNPFDFRYLEWLIYATYQTHSVIIPLLKTIPLFQRAIDEKNQEPLDEMLATKLGFAYFYRHCSEEFSAENVLCWKAIEGFKRKTTVDGFKEIVRKFIGNDAIMQVNIGFQMEKKIMAIKPETLQLGELQIALDECSAELLKLMIRDSFPRFLASPLGKRYAQKLPMEYKDDNALSTGGGGGGGGSRADLASQGGSEGHDDDGKETKSPTTGTTVPPTVDKTKSATPLLGSSNSGSEVSVSVGANDSKVDFKASDGLEMTSITPSSS